MADISWVIVALQEWKYSSKSHSAIVYGIICPCGRLYVGQTQRPMRVRIGEHKCGIINLQDKYPVPHHFLEAHQGDPAGMRVFGIESIGGARPREETPETM